MKNILLMLLLSVGMQLPAQKTILIKCGKLFNSRTGQVVEKQNILVKGNQIIEITPSIVKADSIVDLSDAFVMPGLIDCHTHVLLQADITVEDYNVQLLKESIPYRTLRASQSANAALQYGFTTIRDLGTEGAGFADVDIKKAINNHIIPGPRMFVSTLAINTTGHYNIRASDYAWELHLPKGLQEITGADEARRAVRQQIEQGADWIKIYADRGYYKIADGSFRSIPNFTKEEIEAIGHETLISRKKLAAHAMTRDGILAAIDAGASSIEHGSGMDEACMDAMVKKGVFWCPTLFINDYVAEGRAAIGSTINLYFKQSMEQTFRKAFQKGVKIAYGTDIGGYAWDVPEANDFSYFTNWGMSNTEAIQTATINAAQLLGMEGKIGEITKGAFADIIAFNGDPLKDINVLKQVNWVMKDGKIYKN